MDKVTRIKRSETTYVEQNWRQGGGGRVLTFDMMLELPLSQKVAGLGRNSEVVFEDKLYKVNHREVVRKATPEIVRLALNSTGYATKIRRTDGGRPISSASFLGVGNVPHLRSHGTFISAF